jgi:GAF domain-containing protein
MSALQDRAAQAPTVDARLDRLERLQALTAALSAAATPEAVARVVLDLGFGAVGARAGNVYWESESEPGRLELVHAFGMPAPLMPALRRLTEDARLPSAEAFRSGQAVWLQDRAEILARYPELSTEVEALGDQAWVGVPLTVDRPRGALGLRFAQSQRLDEEARRFLLAVARCCAQALERARLFGVQRAMAARLATLQDSTAALAAALTPGQVAAAAWRGLSRLGASRGGLLRLVGDDRTELVAGFGAGGEGAGLLDAGALAASTPAGEALLAGQPAWLETPTAIRARHPGLEPHRARLGEGAWAVVPLVVQGRTAGALCAALPEGRPLVPEDRGVIRALAEQCAQAFERARLFEAQARLAGRMGQLHAAASELSGAVTPAEVAEAAARALSPLAPVAVELYALAGDRLERVAARGDTCAEEGEGPVALEASHPAAEVARTGRALWLGGDEALAARYPHLVERRARSGIRSCALVPLLAAGRTRGVMLVGFPGGQPLAPEDRGFVRLVALPCAYALDRSVWRHPTPGPLPPLSSSR